MRNFFLALWQTTSDMRYPKNPNTAVDSPEINMPSARPMRIISLEENVTDLLKIDGSIWAIIAETPILIQPRAKNDTDMLFDISVLCRTSSNLETKYELESLELDANWVGNLTWPIVFPKGKEMRRIKKNIDFICPPLRDKLYFIVEKSEMK